MADQKNKFRILSWLLSLVMFVSLFAGINLNVHAVVNNTATVLAFTSDVHNDPNDKSSKRLGIWIDKMKETYGHINCMGFCGDMGWARDTSFTDDQYWDSAKVAFDVIATKGIDTCFTTGNHEHDYGRISTTKREEKNYYTVNGEAKSSSEFHYHIYCLGSASETSEYTEEQASLLSSYFNKLTDSDPVIVLTHYPLHYYRSGGQNRATTNADMIIDALNGGVTNGRKVVLLWGHNHTLSDTNYDKVVTPNSSLAYATTSTWGGSNLSKTIQFYYAAAGCMSDDEYSTGSQSVKGKGLILVFDSSKQLNFVYHKADGSKVNNSDAYSEGWPSEVPPPEFVTITWKNYDGTVLKTEEVAYGTKPSYTGSEPTRETTAQYTYTFSGWSPALVNATQDATYTAQFDSTTRKYTITWKDYDGSKLKEEEVAYGTTPSYGSNPTRPSTAQTDYTFSKWTPTVEKVTGNATYTANYTESPRKYTITWENYNGNTLKTEQVAYGTTPSYSGTTPSRAQDNQYTYSFSGWSPKIEAVSGNATYRATFTNTLRKYTITWKDSDGTTLETDRDVEYGSEPKYNGATPTKAADAQYTYTFDKWSPDVGTVTGDKTYTAQYKTTLKKYTVTWKNYDGTTLETDRDVEYGTRPTYNGSTPTKAADAQYSYTFDKWSPDIETVKGDATYTAQFKSTVKKYTITWKNYDGTTLETDRDVEYGSQPKYNGSTPTKAADTQYSYTFDKWSPDIETVKGDVTYTAQFKSSLRKYTITWQDSDGTILETDRDVEYGAEPKYNGSTPTKATDAQYSYTFDKWTPDIVTVTGNKTYTAQYKTTVRKYTITWKNSDGTTLETDRDVEYGTKPTYNGSTPTKASDAQYSYTFKGWDPTVDNVFGDTTYTAQYTKTLRKYTITWKNSDGMTLETDRDVEYGTEPKYNGSTPTKASTAQYSYTFAGWTPKIEAVTGNATYTAEFTQTTRSYTITWQNYDGSVLGTDQVAYGTRPVYSGATPTRAATSQYIYTFSKWSPDITAVTGDATYKATFTESVNTHPDEKYTITWKNYDDSVLKTEEVYYGSTPSYGSNPTRESTAQYSYTFAGWTPEITKVTKDETYTATYTRTDRKYTITWKDYDGTTLKSEEVAYGATPSYGGTNPTREADAQYTYTFAGWTPEITKVSGDAAYTATYRSTTRKYTVTWRDYNDNILNTEELEYGATPSYGSTPGRTPTAQYTYTFTGWTPEITKVSGNVTYTATYSSAVRKYTITWNNYDGSTLKTDQVAYGTRPEYSGDTPARAATSQYIYTFSGWSPNITTVSGDASYTATFTESANTHPDESYTITWKDYDGIVLRTDKVNYGTTPSYGSEPTRESTDQYSYTFAGWTPKIVPASEDAVYTATYTQKAIDGPEKTYTITWKNYDGNVLKKEEVVQGKKPTYSGSTPTRAATAQYKYTFSGWEPKVVEATADATYVAKFDETAINNSTPAEPSSNASESSSKKSESSSKSAASAAKAAAPAVDEVKKAPVDSSLPVVNPEKIKTTASMKNSTIKIELGTQNADYCLIEYKQSGDNNWKTTTSTASGSVTLQGMKKNGFYQYRITTVKNEDGNWKKGKTSNTAYRWINSTKISKGSSKNNKLKLTWKKVKKASGYEIQYSTDRNFKKNTKKKTVKNKKTEKTISGLKKGKTYYVRIRPVKKKDGKNYLGIFTNAKKVKIK